MTVKNLFLGITTITVLTACIGEADNNNEPPVTNVIVSAVQCNNDLINFNGSKCYGLGTSQLPFIMPFTSKNGVENPVTGDMVLTYKTLGNTRVVFNSALLPDSINYQIKYNNCGVISNLGLNTCDIGIKVNTAARGNINMQLPIITYTDGIESYPVQKQFLFDNKSLVYLTVSDAGNVVNGYIGTGNNINGTVGLTQNALLSFTTSIENASNLSINLTPLTSIIGATPYTLNCKSVENTGQACQYNIQYRPTATVNNQLVTLPYSYNNNVGAYQTGNLQVLVNVAN